MKLIGRFMSPRLRVAVSLKIQAWILNIRSVDGDGGGQDLKYNPMVRVPTVVLTMQRPRL